MSDFWEEPAMKTWLAHVAEETIPKLKASVAAIMISPEEEDLDIKFCVELGAAIMLNKPIIVTTLHERMVPPKLLELADEIVLLPDGANPAGADELKAAIERVLKDAS